MNVVVTAYTPDKNVKETVIQALKDTQWDEFKIPKDSHVGAKLTELKRNGYTTFYVNPPFDARKLEVWR